MHVVQKQPSEENTSYWSTKTTEAQRIPSRFLQVLHPPPLSIPKHLYFPSIFTPPLPLPWDGYRDIYGWPHTGNTYFKSNQQVKFEKTQKQHLTLLYSTRYGHISFQNLWNKFSPQFKIKQAKPWSLLWSHQFNSSMMSNI